MQPSWFVGKTDLGNMKSGEEGDLGPQEVACHTRNMGFDQRNLRGLRGLPSGVL